MAAPKQAQDRYTKLLAEIQRHRRLYYVLDAPEIADSAYDELEKELFDIEARYPDLIAPGLSLKEGGSRAAAGV